MYKSRNERAKEQLGINLSTAQAKLRKQILWELLKELNKTKCFVCGEEMTQEDVSIEHIKPWLDEHNAKELFFNWANITFSHLSCNIKRKKLTRKHGTVYMYDKYKCRCSLCSKAKETKNKKFYTSEKRQERFKRLGK